MKKLLLRSLRDIHRIVPRTLVLQIICMMLQSLMAAITIWLTSVFLNLLYQKDFKSSLICFCMILAVFVLSEVANSIFYSCLVRIDFQTGQQLQIELGEKGTRLSMICYENTETNNMLKRAKNCIEQKMYAARDNMKQEVWNFKKRDMRSLLICEIFCKSGYLLSIFSTILLLLHQVLDVGMMAAALAAFTSFQTAAKYFLVSLGRIPECAAFVKDYYDFMDMEEAEKGTEKFCSDFDSIKVKQLSFSYPGRKTPAVSNLSFTIKRNEVVAIVGNNGGGKTTLVKLLTGLYQAQKGQIYYGRQNLRSLDPEEFYKQISFVSQDFIKYELTVRENIGIGDWKQIENTDKIYMLLHQVGLETFISQASVNQLLGNEFGGRELSVGQWQKLAIARVMMKDSSVIFLDEPTAALDPLMETKVLKMFLKIAREKTAIIVSHRIGICKEVDKIIVMKEGKIAEIGNHEKLLAEKGEYYRLYTMQQKWYEE